MLNKWTAFELHLEETWGGRIEKKGAKESWKWHPATAKNLRQKWLAAANSCQNRSRYSQENKQTFLATANSVIKRCSTIQLEKWDINRPKNTLKGGSSTGDSGGAILGHTNTLFLGSLALGLLGDWRLKVGKLVKALKTLKAPSLWFPLHLSFLICIYDYVFLLRL